jgi:hypothetical protein
MESNHVFFATLFIYFRVNFAALAVGNATGPCFMLRELLAPPTPNKSPFLISFVNWLYSFFQSPVGRALLCPVQREASRLHAASASVTRITKHCREQKFLLAFYHHIVRTTANVSAELNWQKILPRYSGTHVMCVANRTQRPATSKPDLTLTWNARW